MKRVALVAIAMTGCQTAATGVDRAARIVDPDHASRAELQRTVNEILNTNVTIADNALTDSSLLIIERSPPRDLRNLPAQGRIMEAPIQLQLVINADDCILIDRRNQSRYVLRNTVCEADD